MIASQLNPLQIEDLNFTIIKLDSCKSELKIGAINNAYVYSQILLNTFNSISNLVLLIFFARISRGLQLNNHDYKSTQYALFFLLRLLCFSEFFLNFSFLIVTIMSMISINDLFKIARYQNESLENYQTRIEIVGFLGHYVPVFFTTMSHLVRNWIVLLISAFRMENVSVKKRKLTMKGIKISTATILVMSFITAIPRLFFIKIIGCPLRQGDQEYFVYRHFYYPYNHEHLFNIIYAQATLFCVQSGGPSIIIVILCTILIVKLRRRKELKKTLIRAPLSANASQHCELVSTMQQKQNKLIKGKFFRISSSKLVIILCFCFVLLEIPSLISKLSPQEKRVRFISNLTTSLDSTVNLIIYILSNASLFELLRKSIKSNCASDRAACHGHDSNMPRRSNMDKTAQTPMTNQICPRRDFTSDDEIIQVLDEKSGLKKESILP